MLDKDGLMFQSSWLQVGKHRSERFEEVSAGCPEGEAMFFAW
jgi:hypothetical protein